MSLLNHMLGRKDPEGNALFSVVDTPEKRRAEAWLDARLHDAKTAKAGEISVEIVSITPALAEYILEHHNRDNRPISDRRVSDFAKMIEDGRWQITSQGISFARDGRLNNGQHRLSAIVAAGRAVKIAIAFGEERSAFEVLDTGKVRGGSDTLHVLGYGNTTTLAAAARLIAAIESRNPSNDTAKLSNDEIGAFVRSRRGLSEATTAGHRVGSSRKCSSAATTAAFFYIGTRSKNARRLPHFVDAIVTGAGLPKGNAALVLRDGLREKWTGGEFTNGTGRNASRTAAIILGWNLWIAGRRATRTSLEWDPSKPFPMPE